MKSEAPATDIQEIAAVSAQPRPYLESLAVAEGAMALISLSSASGKSTARRPSGKICWPAPAKN